MIGEAPTDYLQLEELVPEKIRRGEIICLGYESNREITLMYLGRQQFEVKESNDKKLSVGAVIKFKKAVAHYPLTLTEILSGNVNTGSYVLGQISGITYIRRLKAATK